MRDMYNDSTGSRKKFLIPLVVLLLCAVSLTGAGYAYNSSVQINGNTDTVDEWFTVDLYDKGSDTLITSKIVDADAADGLVLTTTKVVNNAQGQNTIAGKFDVEKDGILLFKGKVKVTAANLSYRTNDDAGDNTVDTTTAKLTPTAGTSAKIIENDGNSWKDFATLTGATVVFYTDETYTTEVSGDATVAINAENGTAYGYFAVMATGIQGDATIAAGAATDAVAWAKEQIQNYKVEFNFGINAEAVEPNLS